MALLQEWWRVDATEPARPAAAPAGPVQRRAGRAQRALLAASAAAGLANVAQNALVSGRDAGRWGNAHPNLVPYELFDAADRPMVVAVGSDAQWQACARALDLAALADDPRLVTNAGAFRRGTGGSGRVR